MKTNKKKFLDLVSKEKTTTSQKNKERIAKRAMLRESRNIAFKVLEKLDDLGCSQKQLAEAMDVSPQYINKMVKGRENFTLETLTKLEDILEVPLLASFYEKNPERMKAFMSIEKFFEVEVLTTRAMPQYTVHLEYTESKMIVIPDVLESLMYNESHTQLIGEC